MFDVEKCVTRIAGRKFSFDLIRSANTVGIVPIADDGSIILEMQYRYVVGKYLYEIPAGHIDKGESPEHAARRELEEETGYRAKHMRVLFRCYPSPGIKTEYATYYVAHGLVKTAAHLDRDEVIATIKVSLATALKMIRKNQIKDNKTIASILFYTSFSTKRRRPLALS